MKKVALLGVLLLCAAAPPALAQFDPDEDTDEGRSHLNMGPDRAMTQACRAEATQRNLTGKDKRRFVSQCQKREPMQSAGASGMDSTASGKRTLTPMRDPDGRFPPQNVTPSRWNAQGPSPIASRPAIPDIDAEGRPRPH
jgi:hypothetical protein